MNTTSFVPVKLNNEQIVRVEVTELGGRQKVGGVSELLRMDEITGAVEGIATSVTQSLARIKPRRASIEFGVEVGVESGKLVALICKGTGKANLKITLEWEEDEPGVTAPAA